jgi:hypothetical protein
MVGHRLVGIAGWAGFRCTNLTPRGRRVRERGEPTAACRAGQPLAAVARAKKNQKHPHPAGKAHNTAAHIGLAQSAQYDACWVASEIFYFFLRCSTTVAVSQAHNTAAHIGLSQSALYDACWVASEIFYFFLRCSTTVAVSHAPPGGCCCSHAKKNQNTPHPAGKAHNTVAHIGLAQSAQYDAC